MIGLLLSAVLLATPVDVPLPKFEPDEPASCGCERWEQIYGRYVCTKVTSCPVPRRKK